MSHRNLERLRDTLDFLSQRLKEESLDEAVRLELFARWFEEKFSELYEQFQRSECSFGYMAEPLGVTAWDLYALIERRGLLTTNL
jgi:hypothetical protein